MRSQAPSTREGLAQIPPRRIGSHLPGQGELVSESKVISASVALPRPRSLGGWSGVRTDLTWAILVGAAYYLTAKLSLLLALVHHQVTPVWPPTGIALVSLLLLGRRVWPGIAVAAFLVNLPIGPSPIAAAVIAAGNTAAPLLSAYLLQRVGFRRELDRLRDALAIVVVGGLCGMSLSATVGATTLLLSGAVARADYWATWSVWWAGDAMGVLLVAPFLLTWRLPRGSQSFPAISPRKLPYFKMPKQNWRHCKQPFRRWKTRSCARSVTSNKWAWKPPTFCRSSRISRDG